MSRKFWTGLALALVGTWGNAAANAELRGPLVINGKPLPGVEVSHGANGPTVDKSALDKVFGPVEKGLLADPGKKIPLEVLRVALHASTQAPVWQTRRSLSAQELDRAMTRTLKNLGIGNWDERILAQQFSKAIDEAGMDSNRTEAPAPGTVVWWIKRTDITGLRGNTEGEQVRFVLAAKPGDPLRLTYEEVAPHRFKINCLFCDGVVPLQGPDLPGLSKTEVIPDPLGFSVVLWLRPDGEPGVELLEGPNRALIKWPLIYNSTIASLPHECLRVETVMQGDSRGPLTYHHARLRGNCKKLKVVQLRASDRLGKAKDPLVIAAKQKPLLAINGGYFDGAAMPIGVWRKNGVLLSTGGLNRSALIFGKKGLDIEKPKAKINFSYKCADETRSIALSRVNFPPRPDSFSLYTELGHTGNLGRVVVLKIPGTAWVVVGGELSAWNKSRCQGVQIPAPIQPSPPTPDLSLPTEDEVVVEGEEGPQGMVGDGEEEGYSEDGSPEGTESSEPEIVMITPDPIPHSVTVAYEPDRLENVPDILEAGPRLVRNGEPRTEAEFENFTVTSGHFGPAPAPRTVVGMNKENGDSHFVWVVGRHKESRGLTLQETAELMVKLGATDAINLDGGGSSVMIINGQVLSQTPLLGTVAFRRAVPNVVAIVDQDFVEQPYLDNEGNEPLIDPNIPPLPEMPPGMFDGGGDGPLPGLGDGFKPVEDPSYSPR